MATCPTGGAAIWENTVMNIAVEALQAGGLLNYGAFVERPTVSQPQREECPGQRGPEVEIAGTIALMGSLVAGKWSRVRLNKHGPEKKTSSNKRGVQ